MTVHPSRLESQISTMKEIMLWLYKFGNGDPEVFKSQEFRLKEIITQILIDEKIIQFQININENQSFINEIGNRMKKLYEMEKECDRKIHEYNLKTDLLDDYFKEVRILKFNLNSILIRTNLLAKELNKKKDKKKDKKKKRKNNEK
jgi:hypothetical protein